MFAAFGFGTLFGPHSSAFVYFHVSSGPAPT